MEKYDHKKIEKKWQKVWQKKDLYTTKDDTTDEDFFLLVEFPYPSGNLHIGHWYAFALPDIYARFKRMNGSNILFPFGFDSFGLPAENAAIKNGLDPEEWTNQNIEYMRGQLASMGASFDWSREVQTSDPNFYKWTQYIFTKFFEKGLAYEKFAHVNWCPSCKTVLANEQVTSGLCERCDNEVLQKEMKQWFLRTTDYAEQLISGLDDLDWPEEIKQAQRNWIGKKEGAKFSFKISSGEEVEVFTTRPDTLFGVTYLVLAPENPLVQKLMPSIDNAVEVEAYISDTNKKTDLERQENKDKTGVELKGVKAINPANEEEIPVWISDYVLASYGTGAIMAVPEHDERDFEFAKKFSLPMKEVLTSPKYCIFDFDGVIGDTFEDSIKARCEFGIDCDYDEACKSILGYSEKKPSHTRDGDPRKIKESDEWSQKFAEAMESVDIRLFEGFVEEIKKAGITHIAVVSSGARSYVDRGLAKTGLTITHVLAYEDHHSKEEKIENICKDWRVDVKDVYYFTDTKADVYELENTLDKKKIIGCSWGYLGKEKLEEVLPSEQVLVEYKDIHNIFSLHTGHGLLTNSGEFDGVESSQAMEAITNKYGSRETTYRLRDWSIGRQRYWGTPIPIVYDPEGKPHAVPQEHLPWMLPTDVDHTPMGDAPLATSKELKDRVVDIFGEGWTPAVDTMDTFVDSSWYFVRYTNPDNKDDIASQSKMDKWLPVDLYSGGAEHTTMHLLYSRFFFKAMEDCGLVNGGEPYKRRLNRGLIMGPDGQKMSKSRGNVIDPDKQVESFGADSVRLYLAFVGPFNEVGSYPWDMGGIVGVRRFIERLWGLQYVLVDETDDDVENSLHKLMYKVSGDISRLKFNTAISSCMEFVNFVMEGRNLSKSQFERLLQLISPLAPHVTEELWYLVGNKGSIHQESWPKHDESRTKEENVTIVIQVDGKVRGSFVAMYGTDKGALEESAQQNTEVQKWIGGKEIQRIIVVPNKLVSIVTK